MTAISARPTAVPDVLQPYMGGLKTIEQDK